MFITPDMAYMAKLAWAYGTYILMTTGLYRDHHSLYFDDWRDYQRPRRTVKRQRLSFCDDQDCRFPVTIVVPMLAVWLGQGNKALGYQFSMGLMGAMGALLFIFCFLTTRERSEPEITSLSVGKQFKYLLRNDQWIILGVVILLLMCGYVIRGSVAAYYAKYYLNGGDSLISPFLTTGVVASILAMIATTG